MDIFVRIGKRWYQGENIFSNQPLNRRPFYSSLIPEVETVSDVVIGDPHLFNFLDNNHIPHYVECSCDQENVFIAQIFGSEIDMQERFIIIKMLWRFSLIDYSLSKFNRPLSQGGTPYRKSFPNEFSQKKKKTFFDWIDI